MLAIHTVRDLVSLTKPRVTLLVVLTAAGGLALAPVAIEGTTMGFVLAAIALIVGAANALNCWVERDSDALMERTRDRPLPAGRLSPRLALGFGIGLAAVSLPVLVIGANTITALLGALALVSYVAVYTPMKRASPAALLVGAIPGAIPPLMGWTAASGAIEVPGLALFLLLFVWQVPHFLAIAVMREHEYARAGLRTLPVVKGARVARRRAIVWALALLAVSVALVPLGLGGRVYLVVAIAGGLAFVALAVAGTARALFIASILHLTALCVGLVVDRALGGG